MNKISFVSFCVVIAALTGCGTPSSGRIAYQPVIQKGMSFTAAVNDLRWSVVGPRNIYWATGPFTPVRHISDIIVNEKGTVKWKLEPSSGTFYEMSLFTPGLDFTVYEWGPAWQITLPNFMLAGNLKGLTNAADALYFIQQTLNGLTEKQNKSLLLFEPIATEYRSLSVKPRITEDERRLIVQADEYKKEKQNNYAIHYYNKAIELNPTSYPAAYFNMALLYEQENYYTFAITSMKKYLMLVPAASNARSAQDNIYGWELKALK